MEHFEFEDKGNPEMIYCRKRNLKVLVIHTKVIPDALPEHFLVVFGTYLTTGIGGQMGFDRDRVIAFCIMEPDLIEYEAPLIHVLITNAIIEWCNTHTRQQFDKLEYSPNYTAKYIDTLPTDLTKVSPQLLAYMTGIGLQESMDFYEWKEQFWDKQVN